MKASILILLAVVALLLTGCCAENLSDQAVESIVIGFQSAVFMLFTAWVLSKLIG